MHHYHAQMLSSLSQEFLKAPPGLDGRSQLRAQEPKKEMVVHRDPPVAAGCVLSLRADEREIENLQPAIPSVVQTVLFSSGPTEGAR